MLGMSNVGEDKYNGSWSVLGLEGNKLKLISTGCVAENICLGNEDDGCYKFDENGDYTGVNPEIVDLNGDGDLEFEKSIWSYTHSVETLDTIARESTGIDSARCIRRDDFLSLDGFGLSSPEYYRESWFFDDPYIMYSDHLGKHSSDGDVQFFVNMSDLLSENVVRWNVVEISKDHPANTFEVIEPPHDLTGRSIYEECGCDAYGMWLADPYPKAAMRLRLCVFWTP